MDAIGDATDRYTVYVPEELFHLTVPSNAGLIDFVKAAWKKRPLLKCIDAVLLKVSSILDLNIPPMLSDNFPHPVYGFASRTFPVSRRAGT